MNILVIDAGTTLVKLHLLDDGGVCHWTTSRAFPLSRGAERVEMAFAPVQEGILAMLSALGLWCRSTGVGIHAIALTAQRSSVMAVDAQGTPLHPMLMWQSRCADAICDAFAANEAIRETCGMAPTSVFSAPKIVWLQRNRPALYRRAAKLVGVYEALLFLLTGHWYTDDTVASRSCLTQLSTGQWSPKLLDLFGIDAGKLCAILPVGSLLPLAEDVQALLGQAAPLPVVLAGGDQQSAAVGAGCLAPCDMQINTGTGGYVLGLLPPEMAGERTDVRYNRSCTPPLLLAEANLAHCGTAVDRLAALLYGNAPNAVRRLAADAALAGALPEGLTLLPDTIGDRALWDDQTAQAQADRWVRSFGRPVVVAALLDGIALALAGGVRRVAEACGARPNRMVVGGGLTRSAAFCSRLARRLNMPVHVPGGENMTATGALVIALHALLPGRALPSLWRQVNAHRAERVYEPR